MGIIVKDKASGEIHFYMKGADTVMSSIVQYNDWLVEEVDNMAREGLRTLVVARKTLTAEQYQDFEQRFSAAKLSVVNRSGVESIQSCCNYRDVGRHDVSSGRPRSRRWWSPCRGT